jgi:cysteinyl-tRNA synthetase
MASKLLGNSFDVHMGGVDLMFPHHENEIAQSEACTGKPFAKYWIHSEFLMVDGKKMSKSLGNFYTLPDLLKKGLDPMAIRYALLSVHYRQKMNFTIESVEAAGHALDKLRLFVLALDDNKGENKPHITTLVNKFEDEFNVAMDNDLEISQALAVLHDFVHGVNKEMPLSVADATLVKESLMHVNEVLGVLSFEKEKVPKSILQLVEEREVARKKKDFKASDDIRKKIAQEGFVVDDAPSGPKVRRA